MIWGDVLEALLMYLSNVLIIISFICYFIVLFFGSRVKVTNSNGFDVTKGIISEYDSINVIESKSYFTIYNIKRKVIKLSSMCYYGNNISAITLSLLEAGISIVDKKGNKYIDLFKKLFSNLKILYLFSGLSILINNVTYTVGDVRVGIVFIVMFTIISYMLFDIKNNAYIWISDNIKTVNGINKINSMKILNFIDKFLLIDKLIFLGELLIIVRFFSILL